MTDDFPWTPVPFQCDGAAQIDPHYDAYAECARPCLGCPDYTWTYQGSNCAKEQYNSTVPTPCCPVPQQAWRSYYPEVWDCVWTQCAKTEPGRDHKSHEVAQAVFTQFGKFCAEDMKKPLYEYWKGSHFHDGYQMKGFDFEPLLDPEVAVSGYYGWGVLAAWHLGLLAAVISGLRHIPYSNPPKPTDTTRRFGVLSLVYRRVMHEIRWLWHADTELILALVVVWIAIGDISLRGEKLSPMDVLVRPRIDAVPPGYDPILATHLLTVRAAMSVLDTFISVAVFVIFTSWLTRPARGWYWWPLSSRRLHFRVLATLVTAVAGIAVTAKRGICPEYTRGFCTPNAMLDAVISPFGLRRFGSPGGQGGHPSALMHFVRGLWVPWPFNPNDSYSEYWTVQALFMWCFGLLAGFLLILAYGHSDSRSSYFGRLEAVGQFDFVILRVMYVILVIVGHLLALFVASVLPGIMALGCVFTLLYFFQFLFGPKALLGPAPNVSYEELDQILAIIVGGFTAIISIFGSVLSFMHYRARLKEIPYWQLPGEDE